MANLNSPSESASEESLSPENLRDLLDNRCREMQQEGRNRNLYLPLLVSGHVNSNSCIKLNMEPPIGFEPMTYCLQDSRSTSWAKVARITRPQDKVYCMEWASEGQYFYQNWAHSMDWAFSIKYRIHLLQQPKFYVTITIPTLKWSPFDKGHWEESPNSIEHG